MEKEIFELLPDFDTILRMKDFKELDEYQRKIILRCMSADEYRSMHEMALLSRKAFANEEEEFRAVPRLNLPLRASRNNTNAKSSIWQVVINSIHKILVYPVPVYQFTLGFVLLFGVLIIPFRQSTPETTNSLAVHDTVYVIKTVYDTLMKQNPSDLVTVAEKKTQMKGDAANESTYKKTDTSDPRPMTVQFRLAYTNTLQHSRSERKGQSLNNDTSIAGKLVSAVSTL